MTKPELTGSVILDTAKSPHDWIIILNDRGITYTERALRETANRLGARIKLGRNMLLLPSHIDQILEDAQKCRSNRTPGQENGGPKAGSSTKAKRSPATTDAARKLLQSKLPGSGAGTKKSANDGSISSDQTRRKTNR